MTRGSLDLLTALTDLVGRWGDMAVEEQWADAEPSSRRTDRAVMGWDVQRVTTTPATSPRFSSVNCGAFIAGSLPFGPRPALAPRPR
jgi:hypothetical protein